MFLSPLRNTTRNEFPHCVNSQLHSIRPSHFFYAAPWSSTWTDREVNDFYFFSVFGVLIRNARESDVVRLHQDDLPVKWSQLTASNYTINIHQRNCLQFGSFLAAARSRETSEEESDRRMCGESVVYWCRSWWSLFYPREVSRRSLPVNISKFGDSLEFFICFCRFWHNSVRPHRTFGWIWPSSRCQLIAGIWRELIIAFFARFSFALISCASTRKGRNTSRSR